MIVIPQTTYPLTWPVGVPRAKERQRASFIKTEVHRAAKELVRQVNRMKPKTVVFSSNLHTNDNGIPYADATPKHGEVGVAIYWSIDVWRGGRYVEVPYCMPCDKWLRVADNIHALALSVEALRGMDRWGAVTIEQAFSGFAALPPGADVDDGSKARPWREVLGGFPTDLDAEDLLLLAKGRARKLQQVNHPDKGGDPAVFIEVTAALDAAELELRGTDRG